MHPGGGELNSIGIEMLCNCCAHAQILFKLDWTDTCTSEDRHTLVAIAELCFTHRSKKNTHKQLEYGDERFVPDSKNG